MPDARALTFAHLSVLVVEDDAFARKLTFAALQRIGVRKIVTCEHGSDALVTLERARDPFNLVVSDWNMPGMNGLELLRLVREQHMHMPFLMITGHAHQDLVLEARTARVNGYIVKPFSTEQLKTKIAAILNVRE